MLGMSVPCVYQSMQVCIFPCSLSLLVIFCWRFRTELGLHMERVCITAIFLVVVWQT